MEKESKHSLECNYLVRCTSQNNLRTKILWLLYEKKRKWRLVLSMSSFEIVKHVNDKHGAP